MVMWVNHEPPAVTADKSIQLPVESGKSVVMVCGAARSGTTMLDLMLGNSPDAFSCGEVYAFFRPFRKHHFNPLCSCGDPDCSVWRDLRSVSEAVFHVAALEQPGISHVIDSSKDLRWLVDSNEWASQNNIVIKNVLIWKDPVDLAYSHWKRGRPIGYFRKPFLDYYERFLALGLPFFSVSYSELVQAPDAELKRLCGRLGLSYRPGKEAFWHKQHHHFFGSAGTSGQARSGSSQVGLARNFPEAFVHEFNHYMEAHVSDNRLQQLLSLLNLARGGDFMRADIDPGELHNAGRPGWYYRHALKAWFRRHYPERGPVET